MNGANPRGMNGSMIAAVRGPIIMITIGSLFLLQKFHILQFEQSWPIILIVVGALALAGGGQRRDRFRGVDPSQQVPPNVPPYVPPPPPPPGVRR